VIGEFNRDAKEVNEGVSGNATHIFLKETCTLAWYYTAYFEPFLRYSFSKRNHLRSCKETKTNET
jgi:hypothetical protein